MILRLNKCNNISTMVGPQALRIREVSPSTPHDTEGFISPTRLVTSMRFRVCNSKTGGHLGTADGFSWHSGIFSASFSPISEKKVFRIFHFSRSSVQFSMLSILVFLLRKGQNSLISFHFCFTDFTLLMASSKYDFCRLILRSLGH